MKVPQGSLPHLLQYENCWWDYYKENQENIRPVVVENIVKILSCGLKVTGCACYTCDTADCHHTKFVPFTCKSRFCTSCGKKATESWIQKQNDVLPKCEWQHITFTMPKTLWRLFKLNRHLLNDFPKLAYETVKKLSADKGITLAVFIAIHTFGRDLQWHPHIHLSTTRGGLDKDKDKWLNCFFKKKSLMKAWRYNIVNFFRQQYKKGILDLPPSLAELCPDYASFSKWLNVQYRKYWIVHCAKPTKNPYHSTNYLGRYLKRPPIAQSRLRHYGGGKITFNYLNHRNKKHQNFTCSNKEFIERFIQHIPEKHFRMVRYYGILANRNRGKLLPIVYDLLDQTVPEQKLPPRWEHMVKKEFGYNPLNCIVCNKRLTLAAIFTGKSSNQLMANHEELAKMKIVR